MAMSPWILPALKAILPHVGTIIDTAKPMFTKKPPEAAPSAAKAAAQGAAPPESVVQQQITELQAAASQNAANIRELAQQLQSTVAAIEQAATLADARLRRAIVLGAASLAIAIASLGVAVAAFLLR